MDDVEQRFEGWPDDGFLDRLRSIEAETGSNEPWRLRRRRCHPVTASTRQRRFWNTVWKLLEIQINARQVLRS
jgi:hypothetical protein